MLMIRVLCCSILLCHFISTAAADGPGGVHALDKSKFHLFLLVGQSNMAGRGKINKQENEPHPRVLMLNKENEWVPATDPLHFDKPRVVGVGLGRSFANVIADADPSIVVGLIPCAVGGSAISTWEPGGFHDQTKSHPYDDMLPRLNEALKVGTLKAILWHQGESDSTSKRSVVYEEKLHALISRLRKAAGDENVPFVAGQLGQFKEKPWNENRKRVNDAHESLPSKISGTAFVPSDGLGHKGDKTHFSAEAYRELGRRYAKAFLALKKKESKF